MSGEPLSRSDFTYFMQIQTRWADMDSYGHVNNMAFYGFIDSCLTGFLVTECSHDKDHAAAIGLVVESGCQYFKPVTFPSIINCGLRVAHLGTSSVRYEVGLFADNDLKPSAQGFFCARFCRSGNNETNSASFKYKRRALLNIAKRLLNEILRIKGCCFF